MSAIDDVIKSFDQSDPLAQTQKEAVSALAALGESRVEMFVMQIVDSLTSAGAGSNVRIPVSDVRQKVSDVRAYSSSEAGNIAPIVSKTLGPFLKGTPASVVAGLSNLISGTLGAFLGSGGTGSETIDAYYVATEDRSVIRIDLKAWYRNVAASSIRTQMEGITAVVATKSGVDLARVDINDLLNLYQQQLSASGMDSRQLKAALQELQDIYTASQRNSGRR